MRKKRPDIAQYLSDHACPKGKGGFFNIAHVIIANGKVQFRFVCAGCGWPVGKAIPRYLLEGLPKYFMIGDQFIEYGDTVLELDHHDDTPCAKCGLRNGVEWHHMASTRIFGKNADQYPRIPLCPRCHTEFERQTNIFMATQSDRNPGSD